MSILIQGSNLWLPTPSNGTYSDFISHTPYRLIGEVNGGTANSYTFSLAGSYSAQAITEIILVVTTVSLPQSVTETLSASHTYGTYTWNLSVTYPSSSSYQQYASTSNILTNTSNLSTRRLVRFVQMSGSSGGVYYMVNAQSTGLGLGDYISAIGTSTGYNVMTSITHSLPAGYTFSSYSAKCYAI